jgi:hypothetical protein
MTQFRFEPDFPSSDKFLAQKANPEVKAMK